MSRSKTLEYKGSKVTLFQFIRVWATIGLLSIGGPTAQIALMQREIVEKRGWINQSQFLNAISFCMLLPGPEAMQIATYAGWRLHGVNGGLVAGVLFILPGALVMLGLSFLYVFYGTLGLVGSMFLGLKAVIVVVVVQSLVRLSKKVLKRNSHRVIAVLGFLGIFVLSLPFPLIIAGAGFYGLVCNYEAKPNNVSTTLPKSFATLNTIIIWNLIWWIPLVVIDFFSEDPLLPNIGYFFSKLALVTFGGAYAVLAYMAQDVFGIFNWLSPEEMIDGLGLAETTPGPLILVTEFVGF